MKLITVEEHAVDVDIQMALQKYGNGNQSNFKKGLSPDFLMIRQQKNYLILGCRYRQYRMPIMEIYHLCSVEGFLVLDGDSIMKPDYHCLFLNILKNMFMLHLVACFMNHSFNLFWRRLGRTIYCIP